MQEQELWKSCLLLGLTDALGKFQWQSRLNRQYEIEAKEWNWDRDWETPYPIVTGKTGS